MALLTDGNPNDDQALQAYESDILSVSVTEKIDLNIKLGLATEEISEVVLDILLDHTMATDPSANLRRATGVSDVVVTPPMKRWHAMQTLAIVYRDAYNNQLNDRYAAKWAEYKDLAKDAKDRTLKLGIGLASNPVPQAEMPVLGAAGGSSTSEAVYYVEVSWVSALGQEGQPSEGSALDVPAGSLLTVQAVNPPSVATGFNVYIGATADTLMLQTSAPVAVGTTFTLGADGPVAGAAPVNGQAADMWIVGGPVLRRG